MRRFVYKRVVFISLFAALLITIFAGCSPVTTTVIPTTPTNTYKYPINVASKIGIGNYLVDQNGMTLYYNARDNAYQSNVDSDTMATWPVYWVANFIVPPALDIKDFSSTFNSNYSYQITYKGWPLYRFTGDNAPGDVLGQASGGVWYAANVDTLVDAPEAETTNTTQNIP